MSRKNQGRTGGEGIFSRQEESSVKGMFSEMVRESQSPMALFGKQLNETAKVEIARHAEGLFQFAEVVENLPLTTVGSRELATLCDKNGFPIPERVQIEHYEQSGVEAVRVVFSKSFGKQRTVGYGFLQLLIKKSGNRVTVESHVNPKHSDLKVSKDTLNALAPAIASEILREMGMYRKHNWHRLELNTEVFPPGKLFGGDFGGKGYGDEKPGIGSEEVYDLTRFAGPMMAETLIAAVAIKGEERKGTKDKKRVKEILAGYSELAIEKTAFPDFVMWVFKYGIMVQSAKVGHGAYYMPFENGPLTDQEVKLLQASRVNQEQLVDLLNRRHVITFLTSTRGDLRNTQDVGFRRHASRFDNERKSLQADDIREMVDETWPRDWAKKQAGKPRIIKSGSGRSGTGSGKLFS